MKTPSDTSPIEPNATAWAMGELSPAEIAAFEARLQSDPDAAREAGETRDFCQLLGGAMASPQPEIAIDRARLLEAAKKSGRTSGKVIMLRLAGLAACVTAAAFAWQRFGGSNADVSGGTVVAAERRPAVFPATGEGAAPALPGSSTLRESFAAAPAEESSSKYMAASGTESKVNEIAAIAAQTETNPALRPSSDEPLAPESETLGSLAAVDPARDAQAFGTVDPDMTVAPAASPTTAIPATPAMLAKGGELARMKTKEVADSRGNGLMYELQVRRRTVMPSLNPGTKEELMEEAGEGFSPDESYGLNKLNTYQLVGDAPLSTFSIDVDTAAYSNVRRMLNMGQRPPAQAVRLEEMVNYFPYDYASPVDGKPFAVQVEMTQAPWQPEHRLARIAIKGKEVPQSERPAANLVFLVDVSGSMSDSNKLPLVKQSLRFIVSKLTEKDHVSLVTYAGSSGVVLPSTPGNEQQRIMAAIEGLGPGGSTNGAGGITSAYAQAGQHFVTGGVNRVVLATDGDFNVGVTSHSDLEKLITSKAKSGVFLSVLGYGMGNLKDDTMELLADKGNGNYAYIDSLSEARKALDEQFSGTLITIAKDVKIQVEFNPAQVRAYRLLGYENRMLAKEDFTDDKKDAGEIGAGHTVTALYEIIPANVALPVNAEPLKYQPVPAPVPAAAPADARPVSNESLTVKLRWKAPDAAISEPMNVAVVDEGKTLAEASASARWAVAVAGFAELLRGNEKGSLTWDTVRKLARDAKGQDASGYRGEFLQLIDKAESLTGK